MPRTPPPRFHQVLPFFLIETSSREDDEACHRIDQLQLRKLHRTKNKTFLNTSSSKLAIHQMPHSSGRDTNTKTEAKLPQRKDSAGESPMKAQIKEYESTGAIDLIRDVRSGFPKSRFMIRVCSRRFSVTGTRRMNALDSSSMPQPTFSNGIPQRV